MPLPKIRHTTAKTLPTCCQTTASGKWAPHCFESGQFINHKPIEIIFIIFIHYSSEMIYVHHSESMNCLMNFIFSIYFK